MPAGWLCMCLSWGQTLRQIGTAAAYAGIKRLCANQHLRAKAGATGGLAALPSETGHALCQSSSAHLLRGPSTGKMCR